MKPEEETNDLLDFDWENQSEDFFGIETKGPTEVKPKEVEEEEEEIEEEDKSKKKPEEEEEEEIKDDFFGEEASEEEEEDKSKAKKPEEDDNYWGDIYKDFKENNLLKHVELEEGEELTQERLFELQQEDYDTEVSERLKTWAKDDLDADAQAFIKFKTQGGNTADFFAAYKDSSDIPTGDLEDEDYQDKVIRYQLQQEDWDKEEIEDRLEYLTSSGKKDKIAKKYESKMQREDSKRKEGLLAQAAESKKAAKLNEEEYKQSIKDVLEDTKEVSGMKFTAKDKTNLYSFLTKKSFKVSDKKSVTGFQKGLSEVFQDPEKMILLAKLVSSDFDLSDFEKASKTKQTRKVKTNLEQRRNLRPSSSGRQGGNSSLAELF